MRPGGASSGGLGSLLSVQKDLDKRRRAHAAEKQKAQRERERAERDAKPVSVSEEVAKLEAKTPRRTQQQELEADPKAHELRQMKRQLQSLQQEQLSMNETQEAVSTELQQLLKVSCYFASWPSCCC